MGLLFARTGKGFLRHDGPTQAGNMAFMVMLSLFPFLILLVSSSGLLGQTQAGADAITVLFDTLPPEVRQVLEKPAQSVIAGARANYITIGALVAVWTTSSCAETARQVVIRAYEGLGRIRPLWQRRLQSMGIVIAAAVLAVLAMTVLILTPAVLTAMDAYFPGTELLQRLLALVRTLLSPILIFLALWLSYRAFTPRLRKAGRIAAPGAVLVTLMWIVLSAGFSLYLTRVGSYSATYGSLAGVIVTMIFLFLLCTAFVLGAEFNAAIAAHRHARRTPAPATPVGD